MYSFLEGCALCAAVSHLVFVPPPFQFSYFRSFAISLDRLRVELLRCLRIKWRWARALAGLERSVVPCAPSRSYGAREGRRAKLFWSLVELNFQERGEFVTDFRTVGVLNDIQDFSVSRSHRVRCTKILNNFLRRLERPLDNLDTNSYQFVSFDSCDPEVYVA